jgi:uncharacterized membrane protein YeiB
MEKTPGGCVSKSERVVGLDIARAFALLGMIAVNYWVLLDDTVPLPSWLVTIFRLVEGRAAATFVVLAGTGLTLLWRGISLKGNAGAFGRVRAVMLKRCLFLFIVGLINTLVWPADILHFYALYIVLSMWLLMLPNRYLGFITLIPIIVFSTLMVFLDFDKGWDWAISEYTDFWTGYGMVRHIFFNGCYPVLPWLSFFILGMWLGRQNLSARGFMGKVLPAGLIAVVVAESLSRLIYNWPSTTFLGVETEALLPWFSIDPWEPMPLFMLSAGGTALIIIALSLWLAERYRNAACLRPFMALGQMTLTFYLAHVILGDLILDAAVVLNLKPALFPIWATFVFFAFALGFAYYWRKRFAKGPLEWVMRSFLVFPSSVLKYLRHGALRRFTYFTGVLKKGGPVSLFMFAKHVADSSQAHLPQEEQPT